MAMENLHHAELLIGDTHDPDMSLFRQDLFDANDVDIRILPAAAMPHINRKLKHLKPVFQDVFTELSVYFTLSLSFRR